MARLFAPKREDGRRPQATPACAFGLVVEEQLRDLSEELRGIKALLRALLLAVFAALVGLVVNLVLKGLP